MTHGKAMHDWNQTSSMMALHATIHRDQKKKKKGYDPADFNPLIEKKKKVVDVPKEFGMSILKELVKGGKFK